MGTAERTDLLAAEANKELRKTELLVEEDNLKAAFAGESQARNKYDYLQRLQENKVIIILQKSLRRLL